jgi:hypothetical protein
MNRRRRRLVLSTVLAAAMTASAVPIYTQESAPTAGQQGEGRQGGRGGGRRGGRAQQPPPPPPPTLTCTSPATPADNVVPAALAAEGFTALFNGQDLTGWQALIDIGTLRAGAGLNPADLLALSPAERAAKQQESNDVYLKHWSVVDGILVFDGIDADAATGEKGGQNLQTIQEYDDVELYVDWCIDEEGSDSGVYLKNAPQIQIWTNPLGSGGLYNNRQGARHPLVVADHPVNRWNTFHIIQRGDDMTTIWLNGQLVVNDVKMENYWDYSKPLAPRGNIELQYHGDKLYWKNIYVKALN